MEKIIVANSSPDELPTVGQPAAEILAADRVATGSRERNPVYLRIGDANCADCYRCVRYCPVKAIRVDNSHPYIMRKLCISCGTCLDVCLQKAVQATSDLQYVRQLLQSGRKIAISLSPVCLISRPGGPAKLIRDLRRIGFSYVSELAEGAQLAASQALKLANAGEGCIYSNCPAVTNYIRSYRPQALPKLIPIVSPFVAHGRMLKQRFGSECAVVCVSSCVSAKFELNQEDAHGSIDAIITTAELNSLLNDSSSPEVAQEQTPDLTPEEERGSLDLTGLTDADLEGARRYCLLGVDMREASGCSDVSLPGKFIHVRGLDQIRDMLDLLEEKNDYSLVDMVYCSGDCLLGPMRKLELNSQRLKRSIISFAGRAPSPPTTEPEAVDLRAHFTPILRPSLPDVEQADVLRIYEEMDMLDPKERLNCGSCGYPTCRDRAIAQIRGLAERQMCRPWLRKQVALARSDMELLQEHSPVGEVILDDELNIISMNPAFRKMFMCSDAVLGRRISYLFSAAGYEKLLLGNEQTCETIRTSYGIRYKEITFALPDHCYAGLYSDLSGAQAEAELVRFEVLEQAQALLEEHISASQEMAYHLGRSTARSEAFVQKLEDLFGLKREGE